MRPFASTISLSDALDAIRTSALPVDRVERAPLDEASGRVLAADIHASDDVPPFDRAAMDGYAVRAVDTASAAPDRPMSLRLRGEIFAGDAGAHRVEPGECLAIATGAPLPDGADAVVMVEQTRRQEPDRVLLTTPVVPGQHVGRRGGDIASGDVVLASDSVLTPARIGAAAAVGATALDVYQRPRVFVASSGNEIMQPGQRLARGQIYDINRFTLAPVIRRHGGDPIAAPTIPDSVTALRQALEDAAADCDLIVISGGSSVGDRDLLVDAVRERGEVIFHGVAIRPGKPTMLARIGRRLLLGMPGNPTSCLSNAHVLLVPLVRQIARLPPWEPATRRLPLARGIRNASGRHTFHTVRCDAGAAVPVFKGSSDITSLAHADGYIEIPPDVTEIPEGSVVTVKLF
jgi:molybdopterin molybdotransferase